VGLSEHSLASVADWEGRPVNADTLAALAGDVIQEVPLISANAAAAPHQFIDDLDAFRAQNVFYPRQPPTTALP